jgi:hypothetical protein
MRNPRTPKKYMVKGKPLSRGMPSVVYVTAYNAFEAYAKAKPLLKPKREVFFVGVESDYNKLNIDERQEEIRS